MARPDGFFVIAIMLSLLIFIGEGARDAFDPRKLFAGGKAAEQAIEEMAEAAEARGAAR